MKTILPLIAALFLSSGLALAAADAKKADAAAPAAEKSRSPQQEKMADCNKDAAGKKGEERKAFMSQCLKKDAAPAVPAAAAGSPQQNKMKDCNKEAGDKTLKGPERKAFMSECLKKAK